MYLLGFVPNTLQHERRIYKKYYHLIMNEKECSKIAEYYYKYINPFGEENIEFHEIRKQNDRFKYPCSINVYTDFDTHGYDFDIDNVLRDGKCVREIVAHQEKN